MPNIVPAPPWGVSLTSKDIALIRSGSRARDKRAAAAVFALVRGLPGVQIDYPTLCRFIDRQRLTELDEAAFNAWRKEQIRLVDEELCRTLRSAGYHVVGPDEARVLYALEHPDGGVLLNEDAIAVYADRDSAARSRIGDELIVIYRRESVLESPASPQAPKEIPDAEER